MVQIREETPGDHDAIDQVNRRAFGGQKEARLVDRLRDDRLVIASLMAVEAGRAVGHILFSALNVETERGDVPAAALALLAVAPDAQGRGIGSALVRRGLEACRERGTAVVLVLGHPAYYPRFGFSAELARRIRAPFSGDAFMALELVPGALADTTGTVRYPAAFDLAD